MGTTWGYGPREFEVQPNVDAIVRLDVPARGTLRKIKLYDLAEAAVGVFEIYDSVQAADIFNEAGSSSSSSAAPSAPAALYSVTGQLALVAGSYTANDLNISYTNRDGTSTNPVRHLYLRINTDSAGPFQLVMMIEHAGLDS